MHDAIIRTQGSTHVCLSQDTCTSAGILLYIKVQIGVDQKKTTRVGHQMGKLLNISIRGRQARKWKQ